MRGWLRRNTAAYVMLGPFLSRNDGSTELTNITPSFQASKNGGPFAPLTGAVNHQENGWYQLELFAADTQTMGSLVIKSADSASYIPVWSEFIVTSQNAYDSLVLGTDYIRVDATVIPDMQQLTAGQFQLTLYKGDDYYDADGRALSFDFASGPSLSGATVKFKVPAATTEVTGVVSGNNVKFELSKTITGGWTIQRYAYEVEATLSNAHVVTLVTGVLTVK